MISFPSFPETRLLVLKDKEEISDFVSKFGSYSDFNFVSLWSYNVNNDICVSNLNGNLIVRFRDYLNSKYFYSFIGNHAVNRTIEALLKQSKREGLDQHLKLVPESVLNSVNNSNNIYSIKEDRDNFDYILSIEELIELKGKKYEKQRKEITRFFKKNSNVIVKEINLNNYLIRQDILRTFNVWRKKMKKKVIEFGTEKIALNRTLKDAQNLSLFSLGVFCESNMIGFIISDKINKIYAESHFLKYNPDYSGIKHVLHHEMSKILYKHGHKYINIEQDFGIPGLRNSKLSCRPVEFLKKFVISMNQFIEKLN